ncbi:hypothetical protein ACIHEJ_08580 [Streptomyces sp. NPDC052301]|uniref:hypothetical protein n=1 Tax=Streptomyces sp. NPDC052301 TaxID=3365687 RepID=UPI0037D8DD9E
MCASSAHLVRGAVGEDCVLLTPDPAWKRLIAVYARMPPTGAAEAFVDLLRATWPTLETPPAH